MLLSYIWHNFFLLCASDSHLENLLWFYLFYFPFPSKLSGICWWRAWSLSLVMWMLLVGRRKALTSGLSLHGSVEMFGSWTEAVRLLESCSRICPSLLDSVIFLESWGRFGLTLSLVEIEDGVSKLFYSLQDGKVFIWEPRGAKIWSLEWYFGVENRGKNRE